MSEGLLVDRCFRPYLDDSGTFEDLKNAYRDAVRDVHTDQGGHKKAFERVNNDFNYFKDKMEEGENYEFVSDTSIRIIKNEKEEEGGRNGEEEADVNRVDEDSTRFEWEKALEEVNRLLDVEYDLVNLNEYDKGVLGVFENGEAPKFAVNISEGSGEIFYETTYFRDGEGEIENYKGRENISESESLSDYLSYVIRFSTTGSQKIYDRTPNTYEENPKSFERW